MEETDIILCLKKIPKKRIPKKYRRAKNMFHRCGCGNKNVFQKCYHKDIFCLLF